MKTVTIAFDVDGTLRDERSPDSRPLANEDMRTLLRVLGSFPNVRIIVWSGSGELYARQMAHALHVSQWVNQYASKSDSTIPRPDIAIDDQDVRLADLNLVMKLEGEPT